MKVYLCGPMTGIPEHNYPEFMRAAKALRAQGYEVVNPAELFGGDTSQPRHLYMRTAFTELLTCGGIAALPGWMDSSGASAEVAMARELGLKRVPVSADPPAKTFTVAAREQEWR